MTNKFIKSCLKDLITYKNKLLEAEKQVEWYKERILILQELLKTKE